MAEKIRLNKFISDSGICSRREADRYIEIGQVLVNGKRAGIGTLVDKYDRVMVNGLLVEPKEEDEMVLLAFNKPRGIVSTTEKTEKNNIVEYVGYHERIFPIGRLDKDSQGLIFLTNDGDIVNKILRAGNQHEKEYVVTVDKVITDDFISKMGNGVPILGTITKKCKVEKINPNTFKIILVQGLNRQIRRMCEYFGYQVTKLERVRIMNVSLKGIGLGEWRFLDEKEMEVLKKAIAKSEKEAETSKTKTKTTAKPNSSTRKQNEDKKAYEKPKQKTYGAKKPSGRSSSGNNSRGKDSGRKSSGRPQRRK